MGQANSLIKSFDDLKLPDIEKTSSTDEDNRNGSTNDEDETPATSLTFRLDTARNAVYTNRDLFEHFARFLTVQDLISFTDVNKDTKQAVCNFLSHWECPRKHCRNRLFQGLGDGSGSLFPSTCDICRDYFCGECYYKCFDCEGVFCFKDRYGGWCSGHEAFHCQACDVPRFCKECGHGYCGDFQADTHECDECEYWLCINCTEGFSSCDGGCFTTLCEDCAETDLDQCRGCDAKYCWECSSRHMQTCTECEAKFCADCSPRNMRTFTGCEAEYCTECSPRNMQTCTECEAEYCTACSPCNIEDGEAAYCAACSPRNVET